MSIYCCREMTIKAVLIQERDRKQIMVNSFRILPNKMESMYLFIPYNQKKFNILIFT